MSHSDDASASSSPAAGAGTREFDALEPDGIDRSIATPRFSCADPAALREGLAFLDDHGYAVISDVANSEQVLHARELLWTFLEKEVDRDLVRADPSTWVDPEWPGDRATGIVFDYAAGHSELLWFLRGLDPVQHVFREIWQCDDLITSFDRFGLFRPWGTPETAKRATKGGWWHMDQNVAALPGRQCVQGLVSLWDGTAMSGGLAVVPDSAADAEAITARNGITASNSHFVKLRASDPLAAPGRGRLVTCRAGDLLLWDSRTVHCNAPGARALAPQQPAGEILRCAAYICMTPRSSASAEFLELRRECAEHHITTTHWPFAQIDKYYIQRKKYYDRKLQFEMTPEQKRLI